jgi:hypothetical protein
MMERMIANALVFVMGNAELDFGAAGDIRVWQALAFWALQLEGEEIIRNGANCWGAGLETGKDGEGFRVWMIGPSEAAVDDGINHGNGEADGAFVFHHDYIIEVEFYFGYVSKANESGIGLNWLGMGDVDRIASIVFGLQRLRGKHDHVLCKWFELLDRLLILVHLVGLHAFVGQLDNLFYTGNHRPKGEIKGMGWRRACVKLWIVEWAGCSHWDLGQSIGSKWMNTTW